MNKWVNEQFIKYFCDRCYARHIPKGNAVILWDNYYHLQFTSEIIEIQRVYMPRLYCQ